MQYLMKVKWHDVMIALVVMVGAAMESGLLDGHAIATKTALAVLIVGSTVGVKLAERWLPPAMATTTALLSEAITAKVALPKLGDTQDVP